MTIRYLGCALQEPDLRVLGSVLDNVPAGGTTAEAVSVHRQWRADAQSRLQATLASGALKVWLPVELPCQTTLPIFGGSPAADWTSLAAMVLKAASLDGLDLRIVDFTGVVADDLHPRLKKFPGSYAAAELGPGGSLNPLQGIKDPTEATELLADVLRVGDDRSGRNAAAKSQNLLVTIARNLDRSRTFSIGRMLAAVECALHGRVSNPGVLFPVEEADILNGPYQTFQNRTTTWDELFELESMLRLLEPFEATVPPFRSAGQSGHGRVAMQALSGGANAATRELGADLLAARMVRDIRSSDSSTTTLVLGADAVPERLLDSAIRAASSAGTQVITVFERLSDTTSLRLGQGAGSVAGFMRLSNHQDAERAADYLGRQHTFVLAGVSETQTRSFEWGWSTSSSTGTSSTTTRSWGIARGFSSNTSRAFTRSRDTTSGQSGGQSVSSARSVSYERVYEHLLDPSVFQGLGDGALLLVDAAQRAARLTTCSRDVLRSPLVDWNRYLEIGDNA